MQRTQRRTTIRCSSAPSAPSAVQQPRAPNVLRGPMPDLGRYARELRARLWKPPVHEEVRDELDAHLEMLEQDLVRQGVPPDAARAAARAKFGDVTRIAADCRDIGETRDRERRVARALD